MRYLFFDIECCDGVHICEFGYVITDESFNITDKNFWTINPEAKFNLTGRKDGKDMKLFFPESKYKKRRLVKILCKPPKCGKIKNA